MTAIKVIVAVNIGRARKTRKGAEDRVSIFGSSIINMAFDAVKFLGVVMGWSLGPGPVGGIWSARPR